jgi:hypothetical protein
MKALLFGGACSVGKTEAIIRLTKKILDSGFSVERGEFPPSNPNHKDIRLVLSGTDNKGEIIAIYINSATDSTNIIYDAKRFLDNAGTVNFIISSVRDYDFWPRKDFFQIMGIDPLSSDVLEIPLAKITRRNNGFNVALSWYEVALDKLVEKIIREQPYNFI